MRRKNRSRHCKLDINYCIILFLYSLKYRHKEVYQLQDEYKEQFKNREDVILRLTRDNDEQGKKLIDLENKIQTLEKRNEKIQNDTVKNYNG